jgi:hypothetical protein
MRIDNVNNKQLQNYYERLENHIDQSFICIKYIDLGTHIVRLINYSQEFIPLIEKQLSYVLKNNSSKYDATLIVWKENSIKSLPGILEDKCNTKINLKLRIEMLVEKRDYEDLQVFNKDYSIHSPIISVNNLEGIVNMYNQQSNTYYYGVENLEPEEFIKQGHIFVQIFNKILKTQNTALVHGAVVGLNNQGILFCARGQRGKSTLAVLSMLKGFEYISDDYLTLCKEGNNLYSYPIYSIITLSPRMYNELYDELDGKFVSNNARKDKYVISIEKYHDRFRKKYPVKVCMFPQIVGDAEPSIVPCHKGRAVTQLIYSTINQMQDKHDIATIKKLMGFVNDFDFYQINLCSNIRANVECLKDFMQTMSENKENINGELCIK